MKIADLLYVYLRNDHPSTQEISFCGITACLSQRFLALFRLGAPYTWTSADNFAGGKVDILHPFQVADDAIQMTFTKRFSLSTPQRKCLCYCNSHKNYASLAAVLLSTQDETTWLTAISSRGLVALPAKDVCVQQSYAAKQVANLPSRKTPDVVTKSLKKTNSKYKIYTILQLVSLRRNTILNFQNIFFSRDCHLFLIK